MHQLPQTLEVHIGELEFLRGRLRIHVDANSPSGKCSISTTPTSAAVRRRTPDVPCQVQVIPRRKQVSHRLASNCNMAVSISSTRVPSITIGVPIARRAI